MIIVQTVLRFFIALLDKLSGKHSPNDKEIKELKDIIDKVEQEKAKPVEKKSLEDEIKFWDKK
jgi:predicted transcriptional regulator